MKKLTIKKVSELLSNDEHSDFNEKIQKIEKELTEGYIEKKAVLGIDIYKYSNYPNLPQMLIPYFFKNMYEMTLEHCFVLEPFLFQHYTKDSLRSHFIDTGDGGFQIFNSPLEALIFGIILQLNLIRYNSRDNSTEHIYDVLKEVTLRYSLTYDNLYSFEKNFYGTSIINCARIMSKDKLNRFLMDENTKLWFSHNFNGIETLLNFCLEEDYSFIDYFNNYEGDKKTLLFRSENRINKIDLMKIGEISSKSDIISIHNLHLQVSVTSPRSKFKKITASVGNLNTTGLTE